RGEASQRVVAADGVALTQEAGERERMRAGEAGLNDRLDELRALGEGLRREEPQRHDAQPLLGGGLPPHGPPALDEGVHVAGWMTRLSQNREERGGCRGGGGATAEDHPAGAMARTRRSRGPF